MKSNTETLIIAMRYLSEDIHSEDGVANAAIVEAADRLQELLGENNNLKLELEVVIELENDYTNWKYHISART